MTAAGRLGAGLGACGGQVPHARGRGPLGLCRHLGASCEFPGDQLERRPARPCGLTGAPACPRCRRPLLCRRGRPVLLARPARAAGPAAPLLPARSPAPPTPARARGRGPLAPLQPGGRDFRGPQGSRPGAVSTAGAVGVRVCVRFALARGPRLPARVLAQGGGGGPARSSGHSMDAVAAGQAQPATCLWLFVPGFIVSFNCPELRLLSPSWLGKNPK